MKLVATAALAALTLIGCATENDGEGGAYLSGMRPAKPSLDDQKPPVIQVNEGIEHILNGGLSGHIRGVNDGDEDKYIMAENIRVPFPIEGLCQVCDDGVIALRDTRNPGELNVVDDHGHFFCRIWVDTDGHITSTDCR